MRNFVLTALLVVPLGLGLGCEDDPTDLDFLKDSGSEGSEDAGAEPSGDGDGDGDGDADGDSEDAGADDADDAGTDDDAG